MSWAVRATNKFPYACSWLGGRTCSCSSMKWRVRNKRKLWPNILLTVGRGTKLFPVLALGVCLCVSVWGCECVSVWQCWQRPVFSLRVAWAGTWLADADKCKRPARKSENDSKLNTQNLKANNERVPLHCFFFFSFFLGLELQGLTLTLTFTFGWQF